MIGTPNKWFKIVLMLTALLIPFLGEVAMYGLIALLSLLFFFSRGRSGNMTYALKKNGMWFMVLVMILFYGLFASISWSSSFIGFAKFAAGLLVMLMVQFGLRRKSDIMLFIQFLLISTTLVAGYGILQFFIKDSSTSYLLLDKSLHPDISTRVTSIMANPNNLAAFLVVVTPLAVAMIFYKKNIMHKVIALGISGILMICLVLTYSRGAYLGIVFALILLIVFVESRLLLLLPPSILFMVLWMPAGFRSRVDSLIETIMAYFIDATKIQDSSAYYRLYIWQGVGRIFKDFKWFGVGLGNETFKKAYGFYMDSKVFVQHAHSTFFEIFVELGIIGGLIVFGFILKLMFDSFRLSMETDHRFTKIFSIAIISGLAGLLVEGIAEHAWYYYKTFYVFFAAIGLLMAIYNNAHINKAIKLEQDKDGEEELWKTVVEEEGRV